MGKNVVIGNEIMYGTCGKIADLVILYNGDTYAIEIKSDSDSLVRINGQLLEYKKQFNYVIVVCGPKYSHKLLHTLPSGVGLCQIQYDNTVKHLRNAKRRSRLDKQEMLFSVKTSYLAKLAEFTTTGMNADEIRLPFEKKRISDVQEILYNYWFTKMKPAFDLYLSGHRELIYHKRNFNFSSYQSQPTS